MLYDRTDSTADSSIANKQITYISWEVICDVLHEDSGRLERASDVWTQAARAHIKTGRQWVILPSVLDLRKCKVPRQRRQHPPHPRSSVKSIKSRQAVCWTRRWPSNRSYTNQGFTLLPLCFLSGCFPLRPQVEKETPGGTIELH